MPNTKTIAALLVLITSSGVCRPADAAGFLLRGRAFQSGEFQARVLDNGVVELYGEGALLAQFDAELNWRGIRVPGPEISADERQGELTLKYVLREVDGVKVFYTRKLRAVGEALELVTTISASSGRDPSEYLPAGDFVAQVFIPQNAPSGYARYHGGYWQSGSREGIVLGSGVKKTDEVILKTEVGNGVYPVHRPAFWQRDKTLGFSVANTAENGVELYDSAGPDSSGMRQVFYDIVMYSGKYGGGWRTTQVIAPAYRTSQDIKRMAAETMKAILAADVQISFPAREKEPAFLSGQPLSVEVRILPGRDTDGRFTAEMLLDGRNNKALFEKSGVLEVTETKAGETRFDFTAPFLDQDYRVRVRVKDKTGGVIVEKEYGFTLREPYLSAPRPGA